MSVVGFDIGNLNCYIGIARQGGIEVITNDYSLHATPACVSFGLTNRSMGVAARQAVNSNFKNTVLNFKHLIGRKFSDPISQKFIPFVPCGAVQLANDDIGFKVSYQGVQEVFTPEQIYAALLTKLRETIESQLSDVKKVTDCVVTVPSFFTDVQRRAAQSAIEYAGLNPLRVMNESSAIALAYGIYKQDLPEIKEGVRPRHVVFLDIGHSATQASLVAYNKGRLQILGTTFDLEAGGMWFDTLIAEHFRKEFKTKYGVDARDAPRSWLRLLDESEKVKKQMSANQTPIPLNIECFMNDKDVTGKLQRSEFEDLASAIFDKIRNAVLRLLSETGIPATDVDEIEIVGGSSRIPMVRRIVQDIFNKEPKTTMNQDEAVARGAAMQCAILSPAFRVREFAMKDSQPYRINITWQGGAPEGGESDVFGERDEVPFSKVITLYRNDTFQLNAQYANPNCIPHETRTIGSWRVSGVRPAANGDPSKVKVKVRVNPNGIFSVCSATMSESKVVEEEPAAEPMEQDEGAQKADGAKPEEPKPKTKTVSIELNIEETLPAVFEVQKYAAKELAMQEVDRLQKQKADAKNSVEEYVYDMREKLSDLLSDFITEADADTFRSQLTGTEDWLYDEGEDADTAVYEQRLAELKKMGDPVVERFREYEARTPAFDQFDQGILRVRKAYDDYVAGGALHAHLDSKDMEKVITAIEEKKSWLDDARHKQERRSKTEAPVVFVHEIRSQQMAFEAIVTPILSKKPPPPPKAPEPTPVPAEEPAPQPSEMDVD